MPAAASGTLTSVGQSLAFPSPGNQGAKQDTDNLIVIQVDGPFTGLQFVVQGTIDNVAWP